MTHTEYCREWRRHNPGKGAEATRRWRERHPEGVQRDRELARERMRRYHGTAAGQLAMVRQNASRRKA